MIKLGIQPSEAKKLTLNEVFLIGEYESDESQDTSFVLNFERVRNGMKDSLLINKVK